MNLNRKKTALVTAAVVLLVSIVCIVWIVHIVKGTKSIVSIDPDTYYPVTYVIDGDTFKAEVGGKEITIRVLGINTPETVDPRKPVECYGPEASAEGKELLNGRKVRLEFNPNREHLDKYNRYLLYAYRDDGLFYNEYMVVNGYAREYTYGTPYSFQTEFRKDEAEAKAAKLGLWGTCDVSK